MRNFSHESLEGQLADEELSGFLELSDFAKSDSTGSESVRLLDATLGGDGSSLAGSLVGQLLARSLGAGVLASGLLGASHCFSFFF